MVYDVVTVIQWGSIRRGFEEEAGGGGGGGGGGSSRTQWF